MALGDDALEMLRCPATGQALTYASPELVERLNQLISEGALTDQSGATVEEPVDGGLVTEDGTTFYAIRDAIADMLIENSINLSGIINA